MDELFDGSDAHRIGEDLATERERDAAEQDARRYRWLRDSRSSGAAIRLLYEDGETTPNAVDAAIDAAMLKTPNA